MKHNKIERSHYHLRCNFRLAFNIYTVEDVRSAHLFRAIAQRSKCVTHCTLQCVHTLSVAPKILPAANISKVTSLSLCAVYIFFLFFAFLDPIVRDRVMVVVWSGVAIHFLIRHTHKVSHEQLAVQIRAIGVR